VDQLANMCSLILNVAQHFRAGVWIHNGGAVPQGRMKVAQYEVLGNDAKGSVRPGRDDRNLWLLVSHIRLHGRKEPIDRPIRDGELFKNANPALRTGLLSFVPSGRSRPFASFRRSIVPVGLRGHIPRAWRAKQIQSAGLLS
jgi:hypothetical protein